MNKALAIGAGYLVVGVGVAGWTAHRASQGLPHFDGLGSGPVSAPAAMIQCVVLWPFAVTKNFGGVVSASANAQT